MTTTEQPDTAMIGAHQLRVLSSLGARHGLRTDAAMLDYLTLATGREIASRKDLTAVEAAHVLTDLDQKPAAPTSKDWEALRAAFPDESVGKLPRSTCKDCSRSPNKRCDRHTWVTRCGVCGNSHTSAAIHLDFVGHADVTARLLEVDPLWTWRPFTAEEIAGVPPTLRNGLWIYLTVLGVSRPGFGDEEGGKGPKEAIGDALRNAAMRFGVALDLWAKGDRSWAHAGEYESGEPTPTAPTAHPSVDPVDDLDDMNTASLLMVVDQLATTAGATFEDFTGKLRAELGGMAVSSLDDVPAERLRPWIRNVRAFMAKQAAS